MTDIFGPVLGDVVVKLQWLDWLVIVVYIGGMLGLGVYIHFRKATFDDWFMAGRGVTAPLLVATLVSTFYGLDTLFGTSEVGFYEGISAFFAYSLPYTLLYLVMAFVSPKFKRAFPENSTMQDITFKRYGNTAGIISSTAAFIYSTNTMEMMGIGFMIRLLTDWPLWVGVIIGAVIVLAYTWTGGLMADILTDFVQFLVMMIAVGIGLIIAWVDLGGYDGIVEGLRGFVGEHDISYYFSPGAGYLTTWTLIAYSITALAVLCEPAFFQRIFAAASPREVRKAFGIGVPMWLAFDWCVSFLGIAAAAAIGLGVIPEVAPNEALLTVWGEYLPVGLLGLGMAGVLAAAMSTADSYFIVAGGVIGYDIYKVARPKATDREKERMVKSGMLVSAAISLGLAFAFERIMAVWVFQATVIICTCLIPVYFGTFLRKTPKKLAGTLATGIGLAFAVIWYILTITVGHEDEDIGTFIITVGGVDFWQEYGILMGIPISIVAYVLGSVFGKKTVQEEAA